MAAASTKDDAALDVAGWTRRSRRAQGLPATVTDAATLARLGAIVATAQSGAR